MSVSPRYRADLSKFNNMVGMYKDYRKMNPRGTRNYLYRTNYYKLLQAINERMKEYLIYDEGTLNLPEGMGSLYIVGQKKEYLDADGNFKKSCRIDWKSTLEMWKGRPDLRGKQFVYHTNEHTNGIVYRVFWEKRFVRGKNKIFYNFEESSAFKKDRVARLRNPDATIGYFIYHKENDN